jgi:hypothetical protein
VRYEKSQVETMILLVCSLNILDMLLAYVFGRCIIRNSVRTSKKTQHFTITKINLLVLFKEIIPVVYNENHTKTITTKCIITIVKADGTYSYHWALKG